LFEQPFQTFLIHTYCIVFKLFGGEQQDWNQKTGITFWFPLVSLIAVTVE
jgi:hypothetical protein